MSIRTLMNMTSPTMIPQSQESKAVRRDLTLSTVAIVMLFITCQSFADVTHILAWVYESYCVAVACLGQLQYYSLVPNVASAFNSAANFFIYIIFAKGFRKKFWKLLTRNKIEPSSVTGDSK
jgi:hypothetical protein